jgi:hypothetical protein
MISIMPIIPSVIQSPMDLKTKKTCHTKNNYQDHSIIKDEISLMKKTICNFISDLFSYYT